MPAAGGAACMGQTLNPQPHFCWLQSFRVLTLVPWVPLQKGTVRAGAGRALRALCSLCRIRGRAGDQLGANPLVVTKPQLKPSCFEAATRTGV